MVFGGIIDSSCILWSTQGCTDSGACLVHDNDILAFKVMGTIGGMKVISLLVDAYVRQQNCDLCDFNICEHDSG